MTVSGYAEQIRGISGVFMISYLFSDWMESRPASGEIRKDAVTEDPPGCMKDMRCSGRISVILSGGYPSGGFPKK
jgi:hypothetical protein